MPSLAGRAACHMTRREKGVVFLLLAGRAARQKPRFPFSLPFSMIILAVWPGTRGQASTEAQEAEESREDATAVGDE